MPDLPKQAPLVGRAQELRLITDLLSRAEKGNGSALFVAGEGGAGKTRLLAAAADRAAKAGWAVAVGRAYPVETGVPFAVFADALLPMLRMIDSGAFSILTRGAGSELRSIFPTLDNIADTKPALRDDPAEFKARMLWNFSQFLGRLAKKQPMLLVLENLQWADPSSLELFHFAARHAGEQRLLLVGSYNEIERDVNPVLRTTEQSLRKIGAASTLNLQPLSASAVSEVIQGSFDVDERTTQKFSALLYGWTRGNPFFVDEILKSLVDSGRIRKVGNVWQGWEVENMVLPATVREAIESRMAALSENARELAILCAVVGTRTSIDLLAILSGWNPQKLLEVIEELGNLKILVEVQGTNTVEYDFAHPLLQQVLYSSIGHARAGMLHATVAQSLEQFHGQRAGDHADELAFHYSRAPRTESVTKAIRYLSIAGHSALARYANREAASYLRSALDRIDSSQALEPSGGERAAITVALARALQRIGEYDKARALWAQVRTEAELAGDTHTLALADHRIGLAAYWGADYAAALEHFDAALANVASSSDDSLIVRIHLARAIVLQDLGKVENAKAGVEEALAVAERVGDDVLLARVHRALLLLYAWTGPKEKAREHGRNAIRYSERSGQKMLEWTAHWGMSVLAGVSSDADGVAHHLGEAEKLNEQLQSPILPIWTAEISTQYLSGIGEWERGLLHGERAIAQARVFGQRSLLPRLLVWTGLIYLWRGEFEKSRAYVDEAWLLSNADNPRRESDIPSLVPAHHGLASYHLHTRNFQEAISVGEAGLGIADRAGYAAWALQWLLPVVGEAALWAKEWERAEKHSKRMRADAECLDHPLGLAWADACDGLLIVHRDGNPPGAVHLIRKAAERMDQLQIPGSAALVRRHLARALIDSGDREGARQELRRAHDVLARLGARSELEAVRDQMRQLGARPPARSLSIGVEGLTGRELEIARMVAARKSNKEIGSALDISARTVSTHLSNIFAKLGVDSRGALTDYVRERGLADT